MLSVAELDKIVHGERGMLRGIESCLQTECLVSAVTLIFATVDALAALTRPPAADETTGAIFQTWVRRFMPLPALGCSAVELWGARCGVLHTYRPEAGVVGGPVRPLYYRWRAGPAADAERALPHPHHVLVIEALYEALRQAINAYVAALDHDAALAESLEAHLPDLLYYRPFPAV